MQPMPLTRLSLISLLAIAGCATSGRPVVPPPPQCHLPPVDPSLMARPDYVKMVSDVFFAPSASAKPSVMPSKTR